MKTAIMQPYFLPYIGYFQLINAVDTFVIYDDVNFIKGGWINRNNILLQGKPYLFTLPLDKPSPYKLINEIELSPLNSEKDKIKLITTIKQSYSKAPYFKEVYPIVEEIILNNEINLARYISHSLESICKFLHIETGLLISSGLQKDNSLHAQDKVINICKSLNTSTYINAIGGQELYSKEEFKNNNIALYFLKTNHIQYKQFTQEYIPNLSIIDIMMFNSVQEIKEILNQYVLI